MIMIIIMILIIIITTDNGDNRTNYKTVMIIMITMYWVTSNDWVYSSNVNEREQVCNETNNSTLNYNSHYPALIVISNPVVYLRDHAPGASLYWSGRELARPTYCSSGFASSVSAIFMFWFVVITNSWNVSSHDVGQGNENDALVYFTTFLGNVKTWGLYINI